MSASELQSSAGEGDTESRECHFERGEEEGGGGGGRDEIFGGSISSRSLYNSLSLGRGVGVKFHEFESSEGEGDTEFTECSRERGEREGGVMSGGSMSPGSLYNSLSLGRGVSEKFHEFESSEGEGDTDLRKCSRESGEREGGVMSAGSMSPCSLYTSLSLGRGVSGKLHEFEVSEGEGDTESTHSATHSATHCNTL